jgi:tetratricopeptide (TPR) repeat protein
MTETPDRTESVFAAVVALPPEARADYLKDACAADAALRGRVEALLRAHERVGHMLDRPPAVDPDHTGAYVSSDEQPGAVVAGRYKLLEEIGEGGMGNVWMAEQREPVKRLIALKLIKPGMDSRAVLARFEAERQALALMDHPNIARVLDGGTTEQGRPYFVMELVKGLPLTEYCDDRRLSVRARLDLFVQVCSAVKHAHQKGVIHRDLKPSNILVTEHDGKPVPKVIDFGLAKALHSLHALTERTLYTSFGTMVGTPLYMAPEQVGINALDVDTRTDIYALGVILYELLTGTTPLEKKQFRDAAWDEMRRLIREEEPPRPSTRLSSSRALASLAAQRQTEPANLSRLVRGELDWIVLKALEKDRNRRYETANGLAMDVQRHLADEPVLACPPSAAYWLRKFARRHRAGLTAAAAFAALLVVGALVTTWQAVLATNAREVAIAARDEAIAQRQEAELQRDRATNAERQAKQSEDEAKAVLAFFQNHVLVAGRPKGFEGGGLGKDVTLRQAIAAAEARVAESFRDQPLVEASIRDVLGRTYYMLGEFQSPIAQHERALALRRANLEPDHYDTLATMHALTETYLWAGKTDLAVPLAEETFRRMKERLGPNHIATLKIMQQLARAYSQIGKFDRALSLQRETLERREAMLGPNHIRTLVATSILAERCREARKTDEALHLFKKAFELMKAHPEMGPEHFDTVRAMEGLAGTYMDIGKLDVALGLFYEALERRRASLGSEHPQTLLTMQDLGRCLLRAGKPEKAEAILRECLSLRARDQPDDWNTCDTRSQMGDVLLSQKKYAEAEPLLLAGYEGLKQCADKIPAADKVRVTEALDRLVRLYEATGKPDEAAKWRAERATYDSSRTPYAAPGQK